MILAGMTIRGCHALVAPCLPQNLRIANAIAGGFSMKYIEIHVAVVITATERLSRETTIVSPVKTMSEDKSLRKHCRTVASNRGYYFITHLVPVHFEGVIRTRDTVHQVGGHLQSTKKFRIISKMRAMANGELALPTSIGDKIENKKRNITIGNMNPFKNCLV